MDKKRENEWSFDCIVVSTKEGLAKIYSLFGVPRDPIILPGDTKGDTNFDHLPHRALWLAGFTGFVVRFWIYGVQGL